jgi:transcriptional antiterminator NusG
MAWYAIFVETGFEESVQQYLYYFITNLHSLIPKRVVPEKRNGKYEKVLKKLFPGYILVQTELNDEMYQSIKYIPHLIKILGYGTNYSPINEAEIAMILKLINNEGIIDYSKVLIENSTVHVKDGPLIGLEGLITRINKHTRRAKIKLNFIGEPRIIELGIEMLEAK